MQRFLDLFISINCSTCFRQFLRPSSGAKNCTYSVRYCQTVMIELNKLLVNMYKRSQGKTYVVKIWVTRRLKGNKLNLTSIGLKYGLIIVLRYCSWLYFRVRLYVCVCVYIYIYIYIYIGFKTFFYVQ